MFPNYFLSTFTLKNCKLFNDLIFLNANCLSFSAPSSNNFKSSFQSRKNKKQKLRKRQKEKIENIILVTIIFENTRTMKRVREREREGEIERKRVREREVGFINREIEKRKIQQRKHRNTLILNIQSVRHINSQKVDN